MDNLLLATRLLLAGVFGLAGVAKLADLEGSRRAIAGFGMSARVAGPLGLLLPCTELAVALALLAAPLAWWAALASGLLLLAFVADIGWDLVHGRAPDCHCFGQVHSAPAGWPTLVRNLALAVVAEAVVVAGPVRGGADLYAWLGGLDTGAFLSVLTAAVSLGLLAWAVWLVNGLSGLRADQQALLAKLQMQASAVGAVPSASTAAADAAQPVPPAPSPLQPAALSPTQPAAGAPGRGLPIGAPAPTFRLPQLGGGTLGLSDLLAAGKPLLLTFVDPQCGPCTALLPELGRWHRERTDFTLALISRGEAAANQVKVAEQGLEPVQLLQADFEVAERFQALATPSMVRVEPDGRVGSQVAEGAEAIRALVAQTTASPMPMAGRAADDRQTQPSPPTLQADARLRPHPAVSATPMDDDVVIYDPRSGQGHVLNATAAHVWSLLDGERTNHALAEAVAARYSLPVAQAIDDVRELVSDLHQAGLVLA